MSIADDAKARAQGLLTKAVALAPDTWVPGGQPDPLLRRQHGNVGRAVTRIDGPLKVSGRAAFSAEIALDGMVFAALVHATIPKGRLRAIAVDAAAAADGVVAVMTHANAPRMKPLVAMINDPRGASGDATPVMQDDRVRWNGQPVAVVLAETQEQADHAASLVRVSYAPENALTAFDDARADGTEQGAFMGPLRNEKGDADAAFADAAVRVDATYTTPQHNHNAIELHTATCVWDGDTLRVHDASQLVTHTAMSLADMFGIPEEKVIVTSPFVGGGFGGKCLWQHQALAAAAAKLVGRPVRLTLTREGVYRCIGGRAPTVQRVALGADRDGTLTALIHEGVTPKSATSPFPEPFIMFSRSMYAAETMRLDVQTVDLDMLSPTAMRAPGEAPGSFAVECAMDELAHALGIDPVVLRVRNEPTEDPLTGLPFSARHAVEAWQLGAERFGWDRREATPGAVCDGEWLVGLGCASATYPYQRMPGGAARLTLARSGEVTISVAAHEIGTGMATAQVQVAADRLGVPREAITFEYGGSTLPGTVMAGGSQQTAAVAASVAAAHRALVDELLKLAGNASPLSGARSDDVASRDGGLCRSDDESAFETYASILARAGRDSISVEATPPAPLELMHWSMHSHGAMFFEARVNRVTGEVRIARFLGAFDCGRILNALGAASQFRGGIIMGLGAALMEETLFDPRNGRVSNPSLAEYHVPVQLDVPAIEVMWTDIPDPHTPMGARGVGEIGITGVAAAVANAVFNATGRRVRDLPITLDKLL